MPSSREIVPIADGDLTASFSCVGCGRTASRGGHCETCGAVLRSIDRMPTRAVRPDRRRFDVHHWFLGGTAVVFAPLMVACILVASEFAGFLVLPALAVAVLLGGKTAQRIGRRRLRQDLVAWARAEFEQGSPVAIRDAPEGRARVAGITVPVAVVRSPSGQPCLAYERRGALYDGDFTIAGAGGVFEMDDGSGARAVVHAEHVMLLGGPPLEPEVRLLPGMRVDVVGESRWIAATHDQMKGGGLRAASRMLELRGSAQYPVLIRVLAENAGLLPGS